MDDTLLTMFIGTVTVRSVTVPREYVDVDVRARRPDSSPDNVGHRRGFIAVVVLLGSVSVWLLIRNQLTPSGNPAPTPGNTGVARKWNPR